VETAHWSVGLAQEILHEQNASQELETDASAAVEETLRGSRSSQEQVMDVSAREIQHEVVASDAWSAWEQAMGVLAQEICVLSGEAASDGHSYDAGWV
jgi:hypothetical protein